VESRGWIDQRQDETGLTYLHARYYDPQLGTFLSPDPIGPEGGLNSFGYGAGNPANLADRSGLIPMVDECWLFPCFGDNVDVDGGAGGNGFFGGGGSIWGGGGTKNSGAHRRGRDGGGANRTRPEKEMPTFSTEIACPEAGGGGPGCPDPPSDDRKGTGDLGGDWKPTRNVGFLLDFVRGGGRRDRDYYRNDPQAREMINSPGSLRMQEDFLMNGCQTMTSGYGTPTAFVDTALNPFTADWFGTPFQVGGFNWTATNNGDGTATFTLENPAGTSSFTAYLAGGYHWASDRRGSSGPFRTINQTFQWTASLPSQCN
jgi:RHS repeat-associated protein